MRLKFIKYTVKFLLFILLIGSLWMIGYHLGLFKAIGTSANAESINEVLLNISYSYVAGVIFYLINNGIPDIFKRGSAEKLIEADLNAIQKELCFVDALISFIKKDGQSYGKSLFLKIFFRKGLRKSIEKIQYTPKSDIDKSIISIKDSLYSIESMLVAGQLDYEKSYCLAQLRLFLNNIDKLTPEDKEHQISILSQSFARIFLFPYKVRLSILSDAEASEIENKY